MQEVEPVSLFRDVPGRALLTKDRPSYSRSLASSLGTLLAPGWGPGNPILGMVNCSLTLSLLGICGFVNGDTFAMGDPTMRQFAWVGILVSSRFAACTLEFLPVAERVCSLHL